jgi:hypothetical protein
MGGEVMIRSRFGLLGLCAVLFGVMAFGATAALAEVGAQWLFAEKGAGTKLVPFLEASIQLVKDSPTTVLHSKILGVAVLFLCTELKLVNAVLKANGSIGEGFKILFSGCTTDLNGVANAACTPSDATEGAGFIVTQNLHALLVLGELAGGVKDDLLKILPDKVEGKESEVFDNMEFGSKCPIGTKIPVIGKLMFKDCANEALTHLVKHLLEPAPAPFTELWTISKTVEHQATLLGSFWMFLAGAHEGLKFSGDPA